MKNKQFNHLEQDVLEQIIQLRRDVRGNRFTDEVVTDEVIERILSAAVSAPSVGYSQPWEFVVIKKKETKSKIAEIFSAENEKAKLEFGEKKTDYAQLKLEGICESPINIAVFYKPSSEPVLGQTSMMSMGEYSVVCAVQNMWLMARALNIGVGWVSILDPERVKNVLAVPASNQLVAYLCVGYVDEFLDKPELEILKWKDRKEQHTLVHYESYRKT